jgi:hypothetical protein
MPESELFFKVKKKDGRICIADGRSFLEGRRKKMCKKCVRNVVDKDDPG